MYRFFGEQDAYSLFGSLSVDLTFLISVFFFSYKRHSISVFSRYAIFHASKLNKVLGKIAEILFVSAESLIIVRVTTYSTILNSTLGNLLNTGANYFALLIVAPIFVSLVSILIASNPIKQMDFASILLPFTLIFIKCSCLFNGCCWGIAWENGPYNYHYDHPGYQVPVQGIEAFWALAIFLFFLWYKKRAKVGTMFPMYMILFSGTRFFSEFFRHEENVLGPFKTYHILCIIGFVVGIILFIVMRKYGEKLSSFFAKPHIKFANYVAMYEEREVKKNEKAKAAAAAAEAMRKEKAKQAKAKAKARKK